MQLLCYNKQSIVAIEFLKIDEAPSSIEKMEVINDCIDMINQIFQMSGFLGEGADRLIPIFIKVILLAMPKNLYYNLKYLFIIKLLIVKNP